MDKDDFFKVSELAEALKLSRAYVYRLIQTGNLPALHFGRSVRVRRQDLLWYLHEKAPEMLTEEVLRALEESESL
jgi:excisionase family DNA binding protein